MSRGSDGRFEKGLIYGYGIDDTDYQKERRVYNGSSSKVVWYCPTYSVWRNMVKRVKQGADKSYEGVDICDDWRYFSGFKIWFESVPKPNEEYNLDKDLLSTYTITYSPETCCIIPKSINIFLVNKGTGKSMIGTYYDKERDKYQSFCKAWLGKRKSLGRFEEEITAHQAWVVEKSKQLEIMLEWYKTKDYADLRVIQKIRAIITNMEKCNRENKEVKALTKEEFWI